MKRRAVWILVFTTALLGACREDVDLSDSEDFAPLVGACLELRRAAVIDFWPGDDELHYLHLGEGQPETEDLGPGDWIEPAGSRIMVTRIKKVMAFDGVYFFIYGELASINGSTIELKIDRALDWDWEVSVTTLLEEGEPVEIDPENLPINRKLVKLCGEPSEESTLPENGTSRFEEETSDPVVEE